MTQELVLEIMKNSIWTTALIVGPILIIGLMAGLSVGVFQAITQIQEMTLTFIPKIILIVLALAIFLPWMINKMLDFTRQIFEMISAIQ